MSLSSCDEVLLAICIPIACLTTIVNIAIYIYIIYKPRYTSASTSPPQASPGEDPPVIGICGSDRTVVEWMATRGVTEGLRSDTDFGLYEIRMNPSPDDPTVEVCIILHDANKPTRESWRHTGKPVVLELPVNVILARVHAYRERAKKGLWARRRLDHWIELV